MTFKLCEGTSCHIKLLGFHMLLACLYGSNEIQTIDNSNKHEKGCFPCSETACWTQNPSLFPAQSHKYHQSRRMEEPETRSWDSEEPLMPSAGKVSESSVETNGKVGKLNVKMWKLRVSVCVRRRAVGPCPNSFGKNRSKHWKDEAREAKRRHMAPVQDRENASRQLRRSACGMPLSACG